MQIINSVQELNKIVGLEKKVYLLLFKSGTEKSECAVNSLKEIKYQDYENTIFLSADVNKVRDIHPEYGIETVPGFLEFEGGSLVTVYKGCNSSEFYKTILSGGRAAVADKGEKSQKRVTVYSTPVCSWCNTLKTYLKENRIQFRDIDVSVNQSAATEMVNKSGQQGVPQTDINGQIIIGFDKKRIDELLELKN